MFIFLLQIREAVEQHGGRIYLFAVFSAIVWLLWLVKVVLSRRYRPWTAPYETTTSVVIPVVDEPLDLFRDVLRRITDQHPSETIVVINGKRNLDLQAVCEEFADRGVVWTWTPIPGKRNAVRVGTEMSSGEITALVDSDTIWTEGTLEELVKPFADTRVGGVTTRQRILEPERSWITRWADWLENSRALYSMPAQSVLGQIGCLPGRTIAFRRVILEEVMEKFMTQRFLGVFLEVSDDRTLTNLTLKAGYRSVYQYTSLVYTDAPLQIKKLYKQQLRWARGSQYNTLRMLPWMIGHAPVLAMFFVTDIILPFLLVGVVFSWVYRGINGTGTNLYKAMLDAYGTQVGTASIVALIFASSVLSMAIRQVRHLQEKPSDIFRLPVFIIVSTLFLTPIRIMGFFRMAHASGWGTRAGAYAGGDTDLMAELEHVQGSAPVDVVDRPAADGSELSGPDVGGSDLATGRGAHRAGAGTLAPAASATGATTAVSRKPGRHFNIWAGIPYLIGTAMLAGLVLVEVLFNA